MMTRVEALAGEARAASERHLADLGVPFEVPVAPCRDYQALLRGEHDGVLTLEELLDLAKRRGRVLLSGRGAAGKTTIMHRLVVEAAGRGELPFLVDLSRWSADTAAAWDAASDSPREGLDLLLRSFCAAEVDATDLDFLPTDVAKYLLVDGLNETPGSTPEAIIRTLDGIAALVPGCSVIVSDRLVRREAAAPGRWLLATPLPLPRAQVQDLVKGKDVPASMATLVENPFFLDRAMRGELGSSGSDTLKELVERHVKSEADLDRVADAAFDAYKREGARTFDRSRFEEVAGEAASRRLLEGGVLVSVDDRFAFSHHLIHDYLAARHVAGRPELLGHDSRHGVLDALTLKANSFDAVAFAFELETECEATDTLMAVYDWNPYAVGYVLSSSERAAGRMPRERRWIVFAMLAEKRFDRQHFTAQRAADALDLLTEQEARSFGDAKSLDDLVDVVASLESDDEAFLVWRGLFAHRVGEEAPQSLVDALALENAILGWTASNVLKRQRLSEAQRGAVVALSHHARPVVRWRACHVMGGFEDPAFLAALLERLGSDDDESVRYGAVRSVIEMASLGGSASPIASAIIERAAAVAGSSRIVGELSRAAFPANGARVPADWTDAMSGIFYAMRERETDMIRAERWSAEASKLRQHQAARRAQAA